MIDDMKEEAAKFVSDVNEKVDAKADSLLDKVKASKWTAWIVGGGVGAALVVLIVAIAL